MEYVTFESLVQRSRIVLDSTCMRFESNWLHTKLFGVNLTDSREYITKCYQFDADNISNSTCYKFRVPLWSSLDLDQGWNMQ